MKKLVIVFALMGGIFATQPSGACTAGGEGSTSCSHSVTSNGTTTTYSVSCGTGYYACCTNSMASCYPNNPRFGEQ